MTPTKNTYDNDADEQHSLGHGSEADQLSQATGIDAPDQSYVDSGIDDLEKYANQSAPSEAASPKALNKTEQTGQPAGDQPDEAEDDEPKKKRGFWSRRKAAAGGGIIGTLIGGAFFGATFLSGPAQILQLGHILQETHFSNKEDQSDDRFTRMARYLYHYSNGTVEKTRLGIFANKYADRVETNMKKSGIQSEFADGSRRFTGYSTTADGKYAGKSQEYIRSDLESRGVPADRITFQADGRARIDLDGLSRRETLKMTRSILAEAGYGKKMAAMNTRILAKRFDLPMNPIKKGLNRARDSILERRAEHNKEKTERISQGDSASSLSTQRGTDPEGQSGADADGVKGEADGILADAAEAGEANADGSGSGTAGLRDKLTARLGAGLAALVGVGCVARGIDQSAKSIKEAQVIVPMMRMNMEMVSLTSQEMAGNDMDLEELGFYTEQLYDAETKTDMSDAATYRAATGGTGGTDADETAKTAATFSTPFSFLNDGSVLATGLGAICTVLDNTAVQIVMTIAGGIPGAIAGELTSLVLQPIIENLAEWLAGSPIDPLASGAKYVNYMFYGGALNANQMFLASGGTQLSSVAVQEQRSIEAEASEDEFKSQNLEHRLFAIADNKSMFGSMLAKMNPKFSAGATTAVASMVNPATYSNLFGSLFGGKASAEDSYDYPFATYGYSEAELNNPKVANPYQNATDVVTSILPAHGEYVQRAKDCFNVQFSADFTTVTTLQDAGPNPYDENYTAFNCGDPSEDWLQTRMYIFDTQTADAASCYEGDEEACELTGFGNGGTETTDNTAAGDLGTLPTGTAQQLAQQILDSPNILPQSGDDTIMTKIAQTGRLTQCGGPAVDPRALGVLLQMSRKYQIYYGSILDGRVDRQGRPICNDGQHPLGKAIDLNGANPLDGSGGGTGRFIHFDEWNAEQKTFYGKFMTDLGATLAASGGGAMGQGDCATQYGVNYTKATGVLYFNNDSCDHQHMDTR